MQSESRLEFDSQWEAAKPYQGALIGRFGWLLQILKMFGLIRYVENHFLARSKESGEYKTLKRQFEGGQDLAIQSITWLMF